MQPLQTLELILTSQCNLRCGYCFENAKQDGRMSWDVARASLDAVLASPEKDPYILLFGGEPTLEFEMIRRAVRYAEANRRRSQRPHFMIITNGLLLGPDELAFIDEHRMEVQLSFDGTPASQAIRGRGTFEALDRLLDTTRRDHPRLHAKRLKVSITVLGKTIPELGDAVSYFFRKGVREILISPKFTHDPTFRPEMIEDLRVQFRRIFRESVRHYAATGRVPVTIFRKDPHARREARPETLEMCGVMTGAKLAVDVDGQSHGCVLFASSYQRFTTPFLKTRLESLALGDIRTEEPARRLPMYDEAVRKTGIFHDKQDKYSSYGRCGTCRFLSSCCVCPVSIGHQPGNDDPRRVPDLGCAFSLVSLSYRARFPLRRPAAKRRRVREDAREVLRLLS